jgi:hypothetical protein
LSTDRTWVATTYALRASERGRVLAQREAEVGDTAMLREQQPLVHRVLGEILLAEHKPLEAMVEFRQGDVAPDGPVDECIICLPYSLARSFDAAGNADSAIVMYERYLTTPYAFRVSFELLDPVRLAAVYQRLGELYEQQAQRRLSRTTRRSSTCGRTPTPNCSLVWPTRGVECRSFAPDRAPRVTPVRRLRSMYLASKPG